MPLNPGGGDDGADLVGDIGGGESAQTATPGTDPGALQAVNDGLDKTKAEDAKAKEAERLMVKAKFSEYATARAFDKGARVTYVQDRKYAAGNSDPSWASDANLIGSFIDILVSFLYAKNPDVGVRQAKQVENRQAAPPAPAMPPGPPPIGAPIGQQPALPMAAPPPPVDNTNEMFAESMEIIISKLWMLANLKRTVRRQVRSALSVGPGWMKAITWSKKRPQPTVEKSLQDAEAQMARITAMQTEMNDPDYNPDNEDVEKGKLTNLISGLRANIMKAKEYGMNIDFVRAEDMQVSLDVSCISDYGFANWVSEDMYIPHTELRTRFPRLSADDCAKATAYFQKQNMVGDKGGSSTYTGDDAADGTYSKNQTGSQMGGEKPVQFAKIIELWDRRDSMIYTMVDGCEVWAVESYAPPQATLRFNPYFLLAFFEVDGARHPQSLCGRLRKLQDEYSACRSNQRLTRERSLPGLIFNAGAMSPEDAKKLADSVIAEMIPIAPTDINAPLQTLIMAKPMVPVDTRLWDTSAIRADMESLSGVQEALQQNAQSSQPKTATEANIEQNGFASRTGADRDTLEQMLQDLAVYTAETSIQEIDADGAQRLAGPFVFWPFGMDVQDLLTMVNIDISAGSTGKPNAAQETQSWSVLMPLLQKTMVQIRATQLSDPGMSVALQNLLKETLRRMDDRLELSDYLAQGQPSPPPPPIQPLPSISVALKGDLPPLDASMIGAKAAGLPPAAILADGGANSTAMQHASGMHEGEVPMHPLMPQPIEAPKKTPMDGGKTQMPT